ncbi:MAG: DMT family transporter [Clostridium sp.]|nr:DMT family transporter [Clostridium sp.]
MKWKQTLLPLITAMIWGAAFTAQALCAGHLGAFSISAIRFFIAFVCLFPISVILRGRGKGMGGTREVLMGSLLCGTSLFLATNAQQYALNAGASASKAGFVTALYIVLVPLVQMVLYRKGAVRTWIAVFIAVIGMYFLCMKEGFTVETSDLYLAACAALFTGQILFVDHFSEKVDGFTLSCGEFLVTSALSAIFMVTQETVTAEALKACMIPMLYVAIMSSCVGYTFQILAQRDGDPALVSLLFSTEAIFSAIFGAAIMHDRLSGREWVGCALMVAAVVLAEWPEKKVPEKQGNY